MIWRTWEQQEVDLVEDREGKLYGYEFKWGKKIPHAPAQWVNAYPSASYEVISPENFLGFVR